MRVLGQVEGNRGFWVQRRGQGIIILRDLSGQRTPVNSARAGRSAQSPPGGGSEGSGGGKRYFRLTSVVLIQENLTN